MQTKFHNIRDLERNLLGSGSVVEDEMDMPKPQLGSGLDVVESRVNDIRKNLFDGLMNLVCNPLPPSLRPEQWKPLQKQPVFGMPNYPTGVSCIF